MNTKQRTLTILILVTSLVMSGCGQGQLFGPTITPTPSPTPTPQSGVTGRIYRSDTNEPVVNVTVELFNPSLDTKDPAFVLAETKVNNQGQYIFNIEPGEYGLRILEEELSRNALPCMNGGTITYDRSGKTIKETFAYTENNKFYLLQIIPSFTVSAGDITVNDLDMYCPNY